MKSHADDAKLLAAARSTLASHFSGEIDLDDFVIDDFQELSIDQIDNPAITGVFVTLWKVDSKGTKDLRGCIGRHCRLHASSEKEIAGLTLSSALEDPRFSPLQAEELSEILIEISLLGEMEPVAGLHELNPNVYGAVIRSGRKQATLLPQIESINTPEEQVMALRHKAGIRPNEEIKLFRFPVRKLSEATKKTGDPDEK